MDQQSEIRKTQWQLKKVAEIIDSQQHPVPKLIISMDLDEEQFGQINDLFEYYDFLLKDGKPWEEFEFRVEFEKKLDIDHRTLKRIVLAFWRENEWKEVCRHYINQNHCLEFDDLGVYEPGI